MERDNFTHFPYSAATATIETSRRDLAVGNGDMVAPTALIFFWGGNRSVAQKYFKCGRKFLGMGYHTTVPYIFNNQNLSGEEREVEASKLFWKLICLQTNRTRRISES